MKKAMVAVAFTALLIASLTGTTLVDSGKANPIDFPVYTGISIYSPTYSPDKPYENSTVTLNFGVILVYGTYYQSWPESVHLDSVCYSLDEQPLVYVYDFAVKNVTNYGRDNQNYYSYIATIRLDGLSEGGHTVEAYANDTQDQTAYINSRSASYNFTVNSHYQVTVVKILSPTNQTYSKTIPLIFTVNGELKNASYVMYRTRMWRFYESVSVKDFDGNTTLDNLVDGDYVLYLYATTEKGKSMATAYFTIDSSQTLSEPSTPDQAPQPPSNQATESSSGQSATNGSAQTFDSLIILGVVTSIAVMSSALLVYFKKRKRNT